MINRYQTSFKNKEAKFFCKVQIYAWKFGMNLILCTVYITKLTSRWILIQYSLFKLHLETGGARNFGDCQLNKTNTKFVNHSFCYLIYSKIYMTRMIFLASINGHKTFNVVRTFVLVSEQYNIIILGSFKLLYSKRSE